MQTGGPASGSIRGKQREVGDGWNDLHVRAALTGDRWLDARLHDDVAAHFQRLRLSWETETAAYSSLTSMVMHPAYQQIIGLGPQVVPVLIDDLHHPLFIRGHFHSSISYFTIKQSICFPGSALPFNLTSSIRAVR